MARGSGGGVTSRDVARAAGVSQNTVSLVARGSPRVRAETRATVLEAMAQLDYRPNAVAAALRTRTTSSLLFVVDAGLIHDHLTAGLLAGAVEEARLHGYSILAQTVDADHPGLAVELYRAQLVAGALVLARMVDDPCVGVLAGSGCPSVSLLEPHAGIPPDRVIVADDGGGAAAAVRHLLDRGHSRIGLVRVPIADDGVDIAAERVRAARHAAHGRGVALVEAVADDWTFESGLAAASALLGRPLAERPTAVFALSDRLAFGVLAAAARVGISVPAALAVVGFDDSEWGRYASPPLTTVEFPLRAMAREAVRRLLLPQAPREWERAPTRLIVRGSS